MIAFFVFFIIKILKQVRLVQVTALSLAPFVQAMYISYTCS